MTVNRKHHVLSLRIESNDMKFPVNVHGVFPFSIISCHQNYTLLPFQENRPDDDDEKDSKSNNNKKNVPSLHIHSMIITQ